MSRIVHTLLFTTALLASGVAVRAAAPDTATVSFHSYGLVRGGSDAPRFVVSRRWHIEYVTVAGCVVTSGLVDSARVHNARSEAILQRRYGKNWRERFDAEVAAETTRQRAITSRLDSTAAIRALRAKLKPEFNTPWYQINFDEHSRLYTIEVKAWNKKLRDYRTYYVLTAGERRWDLKQAG